MLFTSWIALCGWNKLTSSLLRAIYSIHAILFEPHARLPSFLLGSSHQALRVSLKCHAMPSPVGPTQHTPCATPDATQSQHDLYPDMKLPWGWKSFICTHGSWCYVALIWLSLHLCLGRRAVLGPCTTAFSPQTSIGGAWSIALNEPYTCGLKNNLRGALTVWVGTGIQPCHGQASIDKAMAQLCKARKNFGRRAEVLVCVNQVLQDKIGPDWPRLGYCRIQEEHKWLHVSIMVLLPRLWYKHSSKPLLSQKEGTESNNPTTLTFPRVLSYENSPTKWLPWSKKQWRRVPNAS